MKFLMSISSSSESTYFFFFSTALDLHAIFFGCGLLDLENKLAKNPLDF